MKVTFSDSATERELRDLEEQAYVFFEQFLDDAEGIYSINYVHA